MIQTLISHALLPLIMTDHPETAFESSLISNYALLMALLYESIFAGTRFQRSRLSKMDINRRFSLTLSSETKTMTGFIYATTPLLIPIEA